MTYPRYYVSMYATATETGFDRKYGVRDHEAGHAFVSEMSSEKIEAERICAAMNKKG